MDTGSLRELSTSEPTPWATCILEPAVPGLHPPPSLQGWLPEDVCSNDTPAEPGSHSGRPQSLLHHWHWLGIAACSTTLPGWCGFCTTPPPP